MGVFRTMEHKVKRVVTTTSSDLYLTREIPIHINRMSESFELEQHKHEFIEFNYVSEGSGYQYIEGKTIPVVKGDLFFVPVGASHVFRPTTPTPGRGRLIVYNCLFNETFTEKLLAAYQLDHDTRRLLLSEYPEQPWLHARDRDGSLQLCFDTMYEEFLHRRSNYLPLIQAEVIRLLVHFMRYCKSGAGSPADSPAVSEPTRADIQQLLQSDAPLEWVVQTIRKRSEETLYIRSFAAELGLSERQFRRRFTAWTGMSFTEFVHKSRIEASRELLRTTADKVAVIAQRVGYKDIKFFNRLFKNRTGMTPSEYRSQSRKTQNGAFLQLPFV
jgi:AraC family L-rhamnose operon transcriptional activator RhaR